MPWRGDVGIWAGSGVPFGVPEDLGSEGERGGGGGGRAAEDEKTAMKVGVS